MRLTQPQYLLNLLENQLTLYSAIENSVLPYDNILSNVSSNEENNSKEKHTHMLYGDLWEKLTLEDVTVEPGNLLKKRINSPGFSFLSLKDKNVFKFNFNILVRIRYIIIAVFIITIF